MKKLFTLLSAFLLHCSFNASAQAIFWTENFESGSTGGTLASAYTGPNGSWAVTSTGATGGVPNVWYVSCAENGHTAGNCGTACSSGPTSTGATLHLGATFPSADPGAAYFSGGMGSPFDAITNTRAESPTINCTGKTSITLSFNYIENGDGTNDDATVWYYSGTAWSLLSNPAKTTVCGGGQGQWTHYTFSLPASANNNPSVKIGFNWTNDDDGIGTDPSFAVDSVSLTGTSSSTPTVPTASFTMSPNDTVCSDSCITFTSTSSGGTVDSIKWAVSPTVAAPSMTVNPLMVCFTASAAFTVTLTAYGGGGSTNASQAIYIKPKPSPTIAKSGHTLTVSTGYTSYQWYNGSTTISGATNNTYTYTGTGNFTVVVDSGGCKGISKNNINTAGIPQVSSGENVFWTTRTQNGLTVWSKDLLKESIHIGVYDAAGRRIVQDQWSEGSDMKVFSDLSLVPGLYIIRLNDNTGNSVSLKYME